MKEYIGQNYKFTRACNYSEARVPVNLSKSVAKELLFGKKYSQTRIRAGNQSFKEIQTQKRLN